MKPLVISFFSDVDGRTYYSDHAVRFMENCQQMGIAVDLREKPSLGTYQANCRSKPQFILERMHVHKCPLVWMDIDTLIHQPITIFDDMTCDVALASHNGQSDGIKASPIYLNYTPNAISFIENWIERIDNNDGTWFDHESLFEVVYEKEKIMPIEFLPDTYCSNPGCRGKDTVITMGLADVDSKIEQLRANGFTEKKIGVQCWGNTWIEHDTTPIDPLGRNRR